MAGLRFGGSMIPKSLSFHDAVIAGIEREGTSYALHVEDVAVDDGEDVINGTLVLDDVRRVVIDGNAAAELVMSGDDGEILELEERPGPVLRVVVVWTKYESHDETQNLYLIECQSVRWEADE
ncbi:hypothetical protein [Rhodoplanes sp. Z2-YC6860]|uniref:hypothetical protein n=1 Tax=Rhodoplanes sp. Z2-YC6860 TaxID=674703 RepID=UPI0012EE277A|nr:hypothetical protein [Rhodoplanes sp. Z2-YC6860]